MKEYDVNAEGYYAERDRYGMWGWTWHTDLRFRVTAANADEACAKVHHIFDAHLRFRGLRNLRATEA